MPWCCSKEDNYTAEEANLSVNTVIVLHYISGTALKQNH